MFCVSVIILSVITIIVLKGWELGISESISIVIIIGLSVDYVVHLAAAYMHSPYACRYDKMKQAYGEMGVSILSGTFTTLGSGAMLFGGVVTVFQKFAILITSTIAIAFVVSMVFFGAVIHIMGPQQSETQEKPLEVR